MAAAAVSASKVLRLAKSKATSARIRLAPAPAPKRPRHSALPRHAPAAEAAAAAESDSDAPEDCPECGEFLGADDRWYFDDNQMCLECYETKNGLCHHGKKARTCTSGGCPGWGMTEAEAAAQYDSDQAAEKELIERDKAAERKVRGKKKPKEPAVAAAAGAGSGGLKRADGTPYSPPTAASVLADLRASDGHESITAQCYANEVTAELVKVLTRIDWDRALDWAEAAVALQRVAWAPVWAKAKVSVAARAYADVAPESQKPALDAEVKKYEADGKLAARAAELAPRSYFQSDKFKLAYQHAGVKLLRDLPAFFEMVSDSASWPLAAPAPSQPPLFTLQEVKELAERPDAVCYRDVDEDEIDAWGDMCLKHSMFLGNAARQQKERVEKYGLKYAVPIARDPALLYLLKRAQNIWARMRALVDL